MSRNPVARNAWKVNRASVIPDKRSAKERRSVERHELEDWEREAYDQWLEGCRWE